MNPSIFDRPRAGTSGIRPVDGSTNLYHVIINGSPVGEPVEGASEAITQLRIRRGGPRYPDGVECGFIPGTILGGDVR